MQIQSRNRLLWERKGSLRRFRFNPILEPIREHSWESKLVYNCAVVRINEIIYIIYRALGVDHFSSLGVAWSRDGIHIEKRLSYPIFEPKEKYESPSEATRETRQREKGGCEDPRATIIKDEIYMTYTAYGELPQIALASIKVKDFLEIIKRSVSELNFSEEEAKKAWNNAWVRYGLIFPHLAKKKIFTRNACLFPVEVEGKETQYALIYRTKNDPIRITYAQNPTGPWQNEEVLMKPKEPWEQEKIGICTPPIKTLFGLLFFYHGVEKVENERRIYRLGHIFLEFFSDNEGKLKARISRSKKPLLSPQRRYERESEWLEPVSVCVVFSCGAVPLADKVVLGEDDEILIYYSGGDSRICVVKTKVSELVVTTDFMPDRRRSR